MNQVLYDMLLRLIQLTFSSIIVDGLLIFLWLNIFSTVSGALVQVCVCVCAHIV